MTKRKNYEFPYPYAPDLREYKSGIVLDGVEHGTMAAVRAGCSCQVCLERKKRAQKRGWRR